MKAANDHTRRRIRAMHRERLGMDPAWWGYARKPNAESLAAMAEDDSISARRREWARRELAALEAGAGDLVDGKGSVGGAP